MLSQQAVRAESAMSPSTCDQARKSLLALQKDDTRVRTSLGPIYDKIQNDFIVPLNIRLINNNLPIPELITTQVDFALGKTTFYKDFTSYSQSLEELLSVDCKNEPDNFLSKLPQVRTKREKVHTDILKLDQLISAYRNNVISLGDKL